MGHVVDRWTVPGPGGRRVKGPRHGKGRRWLARWSEPDGRERSQACSSKDEALAVLSRVDVDLRAGTYVRDTGVTFGAFADRWLVHQVHQRGSTRATARSRLRLHVYPAWGQRPIASISRGDVQALVAGMTMSPGMVRGVYIYVRAVFAAAVQDRVIPASPCVRVRLPELVDAKHTPLSVEDVRHVAGKVPAHLGAMVVLGAGTGLRPGELRGLTVDRVLDLGGPCPRVRVDRQLVAVGRGTPVWGPVKTAASDRVVTLAPVTARALAQHLEDHEPRVHGLVFTTARGTPLARGHLQYAWQAGAEGLALGERSGWHDLRHHHASLLIAAGLSPRAVADRLGHADPAQTLRTYSHLWGSDEARVIAAVEGAYGPETDQAR